MRLRTRIPFFGDPVELPVTEVDVPFGSPELNDTPSALPLGFSGHQGENRVQRRAAVATWVPPDQPKTETVGGGSGDQDVGPEPPPIPTRRELWLQRQKHRRGTLDPELRRLQRRKAKTK